MNLFCLGQAGENTGIGRESFECRERDRGSAVARHSLADDPRGVPIFGGVFPRPCRMSENEGCVSNAADRALTIIREQNDDPGNSSGHKTPFFAGETLLSNAPQAGRLHAFSKGNQ